MQPGLRPEQHTHTHKELTLASGGGEGEEMKKFAQVKAGLLFVRVGLSAGHST